MLYYILLLPIWQKYDKCTLSNALYTKKISKPFDFQKPLDMIPPTPTKFSTSFPSRDRF